MPKEVQISSTNNHLLQNENIWNKCTCIDAGLSWDFKSRTAD